MMRTRIQKFEFKFNLILFTVLCFIAGMLQPVTGETSVSAFSSLSADADPHTGSSNMGIPISVPSGRGGIHPNLAVSYNSSAPNGIAGMGWGIEIGSVQRSTKDGVPSYNNSNDTFILKQSGSVQDLIHMGSNIYQPKIEGAFMKIEFVNQTHWEVTDKSGVKYTFGENTNAREFNPNATGDVFKWCLERVEDLHSNYMTFAYMRDGQKLYPEFIDYTGHTNIQTFAQVELNWDDRDDDTFSYISGFKMETNKRLEDIIVRAAGSVQREYEFSYDYSDRTGRSLLMSVQQLDGNGQTALPAVDFSYEEAALNYGSFTPYDAFIAPGDNQWQKIQYDSNGNKGNVTYVGQQFNESISGLYEFRTYLYSAI